MEVTHNMCHRLSKLWQKETNVCERLGQSGSAANDFDGSVFHGLGAMFPMSMACLTQKLAISMLPMALPAQVLGRFLDVDLVELLEHHVTMCQSGNGDLVIPGDFHVPIFPPL